MPLKILKHEAFYLLLESFSHVFKTLSMTRLAVRASIDAWNSVFQNFFPGQRIHRVDRSLVQTDSWRVTSLSWFCWKAWRCPAVWGDSSWNSSLELTSSKLILMTNLIRVRSELEACSESGNSQGLAYRNVTLAFRETSVIESCLKLKLVFLKHHSDSF